MKEKPDMQEFSIFVNVGGRSSCPKMLKMTALPNRLSLWSGMTGRHAHTYQKWLMCVGVEFGPWISLNLGGKKKNHASHSLMGPSSAMGPPINVKEQEVPKSDLLPFCCRSLPV